MDEKLPPPPRMPREWDTSSETLREPEPNPDFYYMYDGNGIATMPPPKYLRS